MRRDSDRNGVRAGGGRHQPGSGGGHLCGQGAAQFQPADRPCRRSPRGRGDRIPLIIDDGATSGGIESTIVALGAQPRLLRPGPISAADIEREIGRWLGEAGESIEAPGQLASHYAPRKPLRLNATDAQDGEWLIGFGDVAGDDTLSASGDLKQAAARLFDALHRADASDRTAIAVAPVPEEGIGIAINDRLKRAAAR